MGLDFYIQGWEPKGIWLQKFMRKITKEKELMFLLQESFFSSCTQDALHFRKRVNRILTSSCLNQNNLTNFGNIMKERDHLDILLTASVLYLST